MNAALRLSTLLITGALLAPGCSRDAKTELAAWKKQACSCQEQDCATEQRVKFWQLVQKFRDDDPSRAQAEELGQLIDQGQACLEEMKVDIYAVN